MEVLPSSLSFKITIKFGITLMDIQVKVKQIARDSYKAEAREAGCLGVGYGSTESAATQAAIYDLQNEKQKRGK